MAKTKQVSVRKQSGPNIVPLGDRVLIQPLDSKGEATTASGIIIPGKEKGEKHERGNVMATGPGRLSGDGKRISMDVKKGDKVWFKRGYDAETVEVGDEEWVITAESNVMAIEK